MKKLLLFAMIILPMMLSAQTVSNLQVSAGTPSTVTFDVSWSAASLTTPWLDSMWVFVDYNKNGKMTRMPISSGTLTAHSANTVTPSPLSPDAGTVIKIADNDKGVWVVGDARTNAAGSFSFSATVQLLTATADLYGACAYASSYPPVANYISPSEIVFAGTPMYEIWLTSADGLEMIESGGTFLLPCDYSMSSFTDATGAPGIINCMPPTVYALSGSDVCDGTVVTLSLSGSQLGWQYRLYDGTTPVGSAVPGTDGALIFTDASAAVGGHSYTVRTVDGAGVRCDMPVSNTLNLTVHPLPTSLTFVSTLATVCEGESVTLVALPAGAASYSIDGTTWYTSNTFTVPASATSYPLYVQTAAGCSNTIPNAVTVAVNPPPGVPTGASADSRCDAGTVTFSASVPGGSTIDWYDAPTGGATVTGGYDVTSFSPSINASTTYYAQARNTTTGCVSATRLVVIGTINTAPGTPTMGGGGAQCGGTRSITATPGSGGTGIRWTDGSSTVSPRSVGAGIYYAVTTSAAGCESGTASVSVTINPLPNAPTSPSSNARCGQGTVTFSATAPSNCTIDWYTTSNGTTLVTGGGSVTLFSPSINTSTTYYARARNTTTGCVSATRLAVIGTINATPGTPTMGGGGSQCGGTMDITATRGTNGDGIRWTDGSSTATSRNVGTGTYYAVTTTNAGCESGTMSVSVSIGQPGNSGQSSACGCASGLANCGSTCQSCCNCTGWSTCSGFTMVTTEKTLGGNSMSIEDAFAACANIGMRLPNSTELMCMCTNKDSLPGGFYDGAGTGYWTSAYNRVLFGNCAVGVKTGGGYVKCVKN